MKIKILPGFEITVLSQEISFGKSYLNFKQTVQNPFFLLFHIRFGKEGTRNYHVLTTFLFSLISTYFIICSKNLATDEAFISNRTKCTCTM